MVILLIYFGGSVYVANEIMPIPRLSLEGTPISVGLEYEDISFLSKKDSIPLKGWYISANTSKGSIIIINGGYQNRSDPTIPTLRLAKDLVDNNFNILLFDLRGRGESEGRGVTLTNNDRDIQGAIDYVRNRGNNTIYILGFSSGAVSSITSNVDINGMILDSCFANVNEMFIRGAVKEKYPRMIARILSFGVFLVSKRTYGYKLENPEDKIKIIKCPILFICGEDDIDVPMDDTFRLYNASNNSNNELWIVSGAKHCQAYNINPMQYVERVISFLEEVNTNDRNSISRN